MARTIKAFIDLPHEIDAFDCNKCKIIFASFTIKEGRETVYFSQPLPIVYCPFCGATGNSIGEKERATEGVE